MDEIELLKVKLKHLEFEKRDELIYKINDYLKYSLKKIKETDNILVLELLELLIDYRNLKDYVKGIESYDCYYDLNFGFGSYYPRSKSIEIYLSNIIEEYRKCYKTSELFLNKLLLFSKIFITCFHEVEHANQVRLCRENNDNIETLILRNSMNYLSEKELELLLISKGYNAYELPNIIAKKQELEYSDDVYYDTNPSERLAEVKSAFIIICSFCNYFEEYPLLKKDLFYYLYDSLYQGYDEYKNPTELFIKKYDNINDWILINNKSNILTSLEKSAYGLEISNKEKKKIKGKINYYYR